MTASKAHEIHEGWKKAAHSRADTALQTALDQTRETIWEPASARSAGSRR